MKMNDILTPKMHYAQIAYSIREVNAFGYVFNSGAGCLRGVIETPQIFASCNACPLSERAALQLAF